MKLKHTFRVYKKIFINLSYFNFILIQLSTFSNLFLNVKIKLFKTYLQFYDINGAKY